MSQLSLFKKEEPRAPPPSPRLRVPLEKHRVKVPSGTPDKHGNFFYQKMHKVLEGIPDEMREQFNYLTIGASPENLDAFEKALRMFNRASNFDRIDFDESRGVL